MQWTVIVACACLVLGFVFGLVTAHARIEIRVLGQSVRPRAPRVAKDPIIAAPIDIRRPVRMAGRV